MEDKMSQLWPQTAMESRPRNDTKNVLSNQWIFCEAQTSRCKTSRYTYVMHLWNSGIRGEIYDVMEGVLSGVWGFNRLSFYCSITNNDRTFLIIENIASDMFTREWYWEKERTLLRYHALRDASLIFYLTRCTISCVHSRMNGQDR